MIIGEKNHVKSELLSKDKILSQSQVAICHFRLVARLQEDGSYLIWACQRADARRRVYRDTDAWEWHVADEWHWGCDGWAMITLIPQVFWFSFCLCLFVNLNGLRPWQAQCTICERRRGKEVVQPLERITSGATAGRWWSSLVSR